jgi:CRISPR-associated endonuclease Cas1
MQDQSNATKHGVVVARGYGIKIYVHRRHLAIDDGVGRSRRIRRLHPAVCKATRLVVIGHTGLITLDAIRWLHDQRVGFLSLDANGELLATSVMPGPTLPVLRRAQALAVSGPAGLELARDVLGAKVEGQRALLCQLPDGASQGPALDSALREIGDATTVEAVLRAEAQAASAYWQAWSTLPIPFPAGSTIRVPQHWLTFGQRASLLTGSPRSASNPPNAILNYLYALLEAETVLACYEVGLDPTLGVFHVDRRDRSSLALDVMEAARPVVDAYALALLTQRTLSLRDVVETRQGGCRLAPRLVESFIELLPALRVEVAPIVEGVAHLLGESADGPVPRLTPLTHANRMGAWESRNPTRRRRTKAGTTLQLAATCRDCGVPVPTRRHRYCAGCRAERFEREGGRGREQAARVLAQLRAEQRDPGHGGRAAQLRGAKNAAHQKAVRRWVGERPDPALFASDVLPGLKLLPIRVLAEATGLSEHYCSLIRLGKRVPHERHWEALRTAV